MSSRADRREREFVREYLATTCGVTLLNLASRVDQATVDFEMMHDEQRVLVAELKTLKTRRPSPEGGWTIEVDSDGMEEDHRPHNGPARIARKITEAHRQLSVYPHPWAIILVNSDHFITLGDLFDAFTGEQVLGTISGHRVVNIASRGVARSPKFAVRYEVDLYIWLDQVNNPPFGVWWTTEIGEDIARCYFGAAATSGST